MPVTEAELDKVSLNGKPLTLLTREEALEGLYYAHFRIRQLYFERAEARNTEFLIGDRVEKSRGYKWPGRVVSVFRTLSGADRVVVECDVPEVEGALHIYVPEQLKRT